MNYLMGVDLGTTNVKVAIFDDKGNLIADSLKEVALYHPKPGWAIQYLDEIFKSATDCIKESLEKSGVNPKDIAGIAFDGQMSGLGAVDKNGDPAMPFDSWLDTRCTPYIERMKEYESLIIEKAGGPPSYSHAPKILRWMEETPEIFEKISKFVVPAVYVASKLSGLKPKDLYMDYTYIHFSNLCDIQKMEWSEEICEIFKIPMDKLPRIVKPWEIVGKVSKEGSSLTGLVEGTPVVAGCGDQAAAMLGAGVVEPYLLYDSAGTASVLAMTLEDYKPDLKYKTMFTARTVLPDLWYSIAFINGGGQDLRWFRDVFCLSEKEVAGLLGESAYNLMNEEAEKIEAGSEGIIFIPHMGGRVCPSEPKIRGVWVGFNWGHTKAHFYRSILEGIAYEYHHYLSIIKELFPHASFKHSVAVGGGSASKLWNRIKASILNVPYVTINRAEGGVFGSALLAGYGVGVFDDLRKATREFVKVIDTVEPSKELSRKYSKYVRLYIKLLDMMKPFFNELLD